MYVIEKSPKVFNTELGSARQESDHFTQMPTDEILNSFMTIISSPAGCCRCLAQEKELDSCSCKKRQVGAWGTTIAITFVR